VGQLVLTWNLFLFSSITTSNIGLPKLTNINYFYWNKRMKPIFISKDLWELVINGYEFPFDENDKVLDAIGKQYLKELLKKDNEALSLIGSVVDGSIFPRNSAAKSSKQACNILKDTYEGVIVAKFQKLRRKFENAKMNANESMNEYIIKIQDFVNQMKTLGEDIPERRMLENILRSLVPKLEMVSISIMVSKDLNTMRIDELSGYLLIVEESTASEHMENYFSKRYRGQGRSRG
jgi:hypothetical protein